MPPVTDAPETTLALHPRAAQRQQLWSALTLVLVGIILVALTEPGRDQALARIALAGATGWSLYSLWRYMNPGQPILVLSGDGVRLRLRGARQVLIPWEEVRDIVQVPASVRNHGARFAFRATIAEVNALVVSQAFHDARIGPLLQGDPQPERLVMPGNNAMRIMLHHSMLDIEHEALRRALVARWHAFRGAHSIVQGPNQRPFSQQCQGNGAAVPGCGPASGWPR